MLALRDHGYDRVFVDEATSGIKPALERHGFQALLAYGRPGDVVIVRELSRVGRNTLDALQTIELLRKRELRLNVLNLGNLSGPAGALVTTILLAVATLERELTTERSRLGRMASLERGIKPGRRASLTDAQVAHVRELAAASRSSGEITALLGGVSQRTTQRALASEV